MAQKLIRKKYIMYAFSIYIFLLLQLLEVFVLAYFYKF